MRFRCIEDLGDLRGRRAVVRVDLNVPMQDGKVTDKTRLEAVKPTVDALMGAGANIVLLAHFGRPKGERIASMSLKQVVPALSDVLGVGVAFIDHGDPVPDASVTLLENTRYLIGEEKNDPDVAKGFAALGDVFVNDAFSAAHRAHASTAGIAALLPSAAGKTMERELAALNTALANPARPVAALVGGAKVSSKIAVLKNLVTKVDHLIIGGGMANTFLMAKGLSVGKSLAEKDYVATAIEIMTVAKQHACTIHLPSDAMLAKDFKAGADYRIATVNDVADDEMILDCGPASIAHVDDLLVEVQTLVWNGPMGAFEIQPFDTGTNGVAKAAARACRSNRLIAVAGGGDTVAALAHANVVDDLTFISTAGGAFLEWMEGKDLPGVQALFTD